MLKLVEGKEDPNLAQQLVPDVPDRTTTDRIERSE